METQTLTESLESFLDEADTWLTASEAPLVAALRYMATVLDAQHSDPESAITPSLMSQYTLTLARLYKLKPAAPPKLDPMEEALRQMTPNTDP